MTYRAIRLPVDISMGAEGGPQFVTAVSETESGNESRDGTRAAGLGVWTISYAAKRAAAWAAFQDFFYAVGGKRDSWRFKDWLDFECTAAQSHLTVVTASTTWQMYKRRTIGGITYDQKIVLPILTSVAGGGTYSVSATTGIITKSGGADPTTFVTQFDKLCRFDTDRLPQTIEDKRGEDGRFIVTYAGIAVKEVPLTSA